MSRPGRALAALSALAALAAWPAQGQGRAPGPVDLVVLVTIDQLRPDYLPRWQGQWTGGFRRFLADGVVYLNGEQDHAITETAPGHSTLLSGRSPASTGIVTNELGVPDSLSPPIGFPGDLGASPRRFRGSTLYDWLLAVDPDARALSVSRKDRGAILPIGRSHAEVYWWVRNQFTTSRWYGDSLPAWVKAWNERQGPARATARPWELLLATAEYPEADDGPWENGGKDVTFPHPMQPAGIAGYPWMDSLTIDFALDGVRQLGLGRRGRADLLSVSLSATDAIGHSYGPDSREVHDHLLRLDRWLGWFMDSLAAAVPGGRVVYALSSDHGVTAFPEQARQAGRRGGRASLDSLARAVGEQFRRRYRADFGFDHTNGLLYADVPALRARGVDTDSLARAMALAAKVQDGVTQAYTPRTLAGARDPHAGRWKRSIPADFPWLVAAVLAPGYIWSYSAARTTHGTTNPDDVRVPIAFLGRGIASARPARVARTVDIGPTLAALLGVRPTERVEGVALPEVIGRKK